MCTGTTSARPTGFPAGASRIDLFDYLKKGALRGGEIQWKIENGKLKTSFGSV